MHASLLSSREVGAAAMLRGLVQMLLPTCRSNELLLEAPCMQRRSQQPQAALRKLHCRHLHVPCTQHVPQWFGCTPSPIILLHAEARRNACGGTAKLGPAH